MVDTPPTTASRKSVSFGVSPSSAVGPSNPAADQSLLTCRSAVPEVISLTNDFDDVDQQTTNVLEGIDDASRYMEAHTDNEFDVATYMDAFRTDLLALSRLVHLQSGRLDKVLEAFAASSKLGRKVHRQRSVGPDGSTSDSDTQSDLGAQFNSDKSEKSISLRVAKPPVFKGLATDDFDDFMLNVYLNFDNSGPKGILPTKSKIAFVVSYLGGNAAKWYINHVAKPELKFKSFQEFADVFAAFFGEDPRVAEAIANDKAKTLMQTTSCQAYACDFLRWIAGTQHNDYTKMLMFKQGLKLHVMNYIDSLEPQPTNVSMLMRKAIVFDERVFANNKRSGFSKGNQGSGSNPHCSNNPGATSKPTGSADVAATDVKSGKPTHEERQRRKDKGLCAYCGQDGCKGASDTKACPLLGAKKRSELPGKGRVSFPLHY
ncbi:UNVERIFIED_CONTAM: hypothetical protein HDU68_000109 [Siphonaria sp. JEL0065]|nr:hypothetical protein HDU68_000109 [Siphonaria sp. JEL0065]